nr:uncharacterized protein LOC127482582 isoform X3 [Oryctolagus cuniculus]XP_051700572.1 uncharacterized protein LOC127482582 isoform X3 [Oryctolagus cuniculus]
MVHGLSTTSHGFAMKGEHHHLKSTFLGHLGSMSVSDLTELPANEVPELLAKEYSWRRNKQRVFQAACKHGETNVCLPASVTGELHRNQLAEASKERGQLSSLRRKQLPGEAAGTAGMHCSNAPCRPPQHSRNAPAGSEDQAKTARISARRPVRKHWSFRSRDWETGGPGARFPGRGRARGAGPWGHLHPAHPDSCPALGIRWLPHTTTVQFSPLPHPR